MLADPISTSDPAGGTVNWRLLADGTRVSSLLVNGAPMVMTIRHTTVKANQRTKVKASRRSNIKIDVPFRDSVSGEVDPVTINLTVNKSNLNNDQLAGSVFARVLAMTAQLIDTTNESRRDDIFAGMS